MLGGEINFSKGKIFLICCLGFILGNFCWGTLSCRGAMQCWGTMHRALTDNFFYLILILIIFLGFLIIFWKHKLLRVVFLGLGFFCLACLDYSWAVFKEIPNKNNIWFYNNKTVNFVGYISSEVEEISSKSRFKFKTIEIIDKNIKVNGLVLVTTNLYPLYNYGDKLKIKCKLRQPEKINDFSYDLYLARYNIYSLCYNPKIEKIGCSTNWFYGGLFKFKKLIKNSIDKGLPEPLSSLAVPIVLGGNQSLPSEYKQMFSDLGLSHIMAVSGFNISIIASIVMSCLLFLGLNRRQAFYFSILFLIFYCLLVGLPASAIRAGLMGSLILLAIHLSRLNKIINALSFSASLMLLINPKLLKDDVGFQLSFLAILGLIYCQPIISNFFDKLKIPKLKGLRDAFSTTLAAQIFTLPILAINFKKISLISPLANMLIVPIISLLTILILGAIFLTIIFPFLAKLFFLPALILLKYIFVVVEFLNKISFKLISVNNFSWIYVLIYYITVISVIVILKVFKVHKV